MPISIFRIVMIAWIASLLVGFSVAQCDRIELQRTDGTAEDMFGKELAVSGDAAIVGAEWDDSLGRNVGSAYVFERVSEEWVLVQELVPSDGQPGDHFGFSVAIDGARAVVGTEWGTGLVPRSGSAYVFERTDKGWVETAKLFATDGGADDWFGKSVAVSGDQVLVGCPFHHTGSGWVYAFEPTVQGWMQTQKFQGIGATYGDYFAYSLAMHGDRAVVGAPGPGGSGIGSVFFFERTGADWSQVSEVLPSDGSPEDYFGHGCDITGDVALAGAYGKGRAYVLEFTGSDWVETALLDPPEGLQSSSFGFSVATDAGRALVGAFTTAGTSAFLYEREGSEWSFVSGIHEVLGPGYWVGVVALSGEVGVLGGRNWSGDTVPGSAFVFDVIPGRVENYCIGAPNSVGEGARIHFEGSLSASRNEATLLATDMPPGAVGLFFAGVYPFQLPFADGYLCVSPFAPGLLRLGPPSQASADGESSRLLDFTTFPDSHAVLEGATRYFQTWYRDSMGPGGTGSNLTDGLRVTLCL